MDVQHDLCEPPFTAVAGLPRERDRFHPVSNRLILKSALKRILIRRLMAEFFGGIALKSNGLGPVVRRQSRFSFELADEFIRRR